MRGSREATEEGERPAAVRTTTQRVVRRVVVGRAGADLQLERGGQRLWQALGGGLCSELRLQGCERGAGVGGQEAGRADFLEAFGQDVLQETLHEAHDVERHGRPGFLSRGFLSRFVAERDLPLFQGDQSSVREGHAGNVGGQVFQGGASVPDRFAMHAPFFAPGLRRDLGEEGWIRRVQGVAKLRPEDLPQGRGGHQKLRG